MSGQAAAAAVCAATRTACAPARASDRLRDLRSGDRSWSSHRSRNTPQRHPASAARQPDGRHGAPRLTVRRPRVRRIIGEHPRSRRARCCERSAGPSSPRSALSPNADASPTRSARRLIDAFCATRTRDESDRGAGRGGLRGRTAESIGRSSTTRRWSLALRSPGWMTRLEIVVNNAFPRFERAVLLGSSRGAPRSAPTGRRPGRDLGLPTRSCRACRQPSDR